MSFVVLALGLVLPPAQHVENPPLSPISERELQYGGAACSFLVGDRLYLLLEPDDTVVVKPSGVLRHVKLPGIGATIDRRSSFAVADVRIRIAQSRHPFLRAAEDERYRATLTVNSARESQTLRGVWDCGA